MPKTMGKQLVMGMAGNLRGSKVLGSGGFQLSGDYSGSGSVQFSPMTFSTFQDLVMAAKGKEPLPVEGSLEGKLTFSGPAKTPARMNARLEIPALRIAPARPGFSAAQVAELTLRNPEPIVVDYDGKVPKSAARICSERNRSSSLRRSQPERKKSMGSARRRKP